MKKIIHDDAHTELLSENEALRSAIKRGELDFDQSEAINEELHAEIRVLRAALARMEARVLMLEDARRKN